jgi:serine/threonine protein kinase
LNSALAVPLAAPEILLNQKISEKADVYSFGVMLWEIVTGIAPVRGGLSDVSVPEDCPAEISDLIKVRAWWCSTRPCLVFTWLHAFPPAKCLFSRHGNATLL